MGAILGYVEKLKELNTDGILPTSHAVPMENAFREDAARPSIGIEKALSNAPDRVENFYRVPKVIE
jgi:aspartyl-tRNA(Asn)/glutamyl-tRNA(Gln) amidotransferase subunit C